ncbi:MAG: VTT domain-containing protein [Brasilonema octagenarum HA4186-MV1]|jgi:membrane protein DedA with SNARE-associated domain|uniref:DedA family protein n=2 Tax=Brasilonema TaxID=383614 RepID=A0A856ME52_9CYAN|nr:MULTISPECIES: DedA family protein [Brasilonema]MBW4624113.1 VTT domain-containing protein [Brasilonema octagenarum HA4186-MV1]NMF66893.1 DedA family protein [Brasilonema octagenarum UFV-OR1]QDL08942.1 DedA family protein [Brasilonema sennae CENA114]QDL15297.1 DedA family protein [Brasilonema octagenarum UFV-E1]
MLEWITNTINSLGYWGIALLMFVENLFPPIPSELIMPLAGFTARATPEKLNVFGVFFAGLLGSVFGALIWYYPGRLFGEKRLQAWADRYGKWLTISSKDITKAKNWFDQQGGKAVCIGRLVPGVRTLISVPAGMSHMPLLPFLIYSTLGSAVWVGLLTFSGYALGSQYELVDKYLAPVSKIVAVVLILGFVVWVMKRKRKNRRK